MIKLLIKILVLFIFIGCEPAQKNELEKVIQKTKKIVEKKLITNEPKEDSKKTVKNNKIFYLIGDPFFVDGVKYIPEENYNYSEVGLATFYGKELHNSKTLNNDRNKVTELLGRHNTLPLPSIVKVTNIENGLSITLKIIDRHQENGTIIQVSRKVAQLLGFYKNKFAKVRIEINSDASKQWKNVTNSMNEPLFNETVESAPTDKVLISNLNDVQDDKIKIINVEQPIQLDLEPVENLDLYLKIKNFNSYQEIIDILENLELNLKYTSESEGSQYNLILGPLDNELANKLVSSFVTKGYKNTKLILE